MSDIIFYILFIAVATLIGLLWVLGILRHYFPGYYGERCVAFLLWWLPREKYQTINNLLIPYLGSTTQIDHIVISVHGIFIIETKTYKGIISGTDNADHWRQILYSNMYNMPNPVRQNKLHIRAIVDILKRMNITCSIYPIVAFPSYATIHAQSLDSALIHFSQLRRYIQSWRTYELSQAQVDDLYDRLTSVNRTGWKAHLQHARSVRQRVSERNQKVGSGICPNCGGRLIRRSGTYGLFYGCSNYPRCKYTLDIR